MYCIYILIRKQVDSFVFTVQWYVYVVSLYTSVSVSVCTYIHIIMMIIIILLLHEHWAYLNFSCTQQSILRLTTYFQCFSLILFLESDVYTRYLYLYYYYYCLSVWCGAVWMCILLLYDIRLIVEWANEHWACRRIHLLSIYRQISFILFYCRVCKKSIYHLTGIKRQHLNSWMFLARKYVINFETPSVIVIDIFYTYRVSIRRRP